MKLFLPVLTKCASDCYKYAHFTLQMIGFDKLRKQIVEKL